MNPRGVVALGRAPQTGWKMAAFCRKPLRGSWKEIPVNATYTEPIPNLLQQQEGFVVPPEVEAEVDELITHYPVKRSASLMVLHALQEHFGWISQEAVEWTARKLELRPINIYELVTFYPMFRPRPMGRYQIKVCRTLSCALGGAPQLHRHFCERLGLDPLAHGPQTTKDGKFSVEFVECLASCGTAPVMMVNDSFYEGVTHAKADEIVRQCK
jgi:NADH-quinone oxidoreductase subunit E